MRRRTVLAATGAGLASLSGCLDSASGYSAPGSTTGTPPAVPESKPPVNTGGGTAGEPSGTYERVAVGTRDGVSEAFRPHVLHIWHTAGSEQRVSLRILDRVAETTAHRAQYTIPTDGILEVRLLTPSKYYVQLWGPAIDTPETLLVPCSFFDCNHSTTGISILETGEVQSLVSSTLVACPSPPYC